MMKLLKDGIDTVSKWRPIQNFVQDLSSLRALWCWIFLACYLILTGYIAIVNQDAHTTIITVWGGVIATIFTNYVISTTYERIKKTRSVSNMPTSVSNTPSSVNNDAEHGASD